MSESVETAYFAPVSGLQVYASRVPSGAHDKKKLSKRGYNQAACLARALGKNMQLPVDEKLVKRVRNTAPMKRLNPAERQNNLKKAF